MARPSEMLFDFASDIWKSVGFGNPYALGYFMLGLLISGIFVAGVFFPAFASSLAWTAGGTVGLVTGIAALTTFARAGDLVAIVLALAVGALCGGVTVAAAAAIAYVAPVITAILLLPNIVAGTAAILGSVSYCLENICFGIAACIQGLCSCLYKCFCCCCIPSSGNDDDDDYGHSSTHRAQQPILQGANNARINNSMRGGAQNRPEHGNNSGGRSSHTPAYNPASDYGSTGARYFPSQHPLPSAPPPPYPGSASTSSASASTRSQGQPQGIQSNTSTDPVAEYFKFLDSVTSTSHHHHHHPAPPSAPPSASQQQRPRPAASASASSQQNHSTMHQPANRTSSSNNTHANHKQYQYSGKMTDVKEVNSTKTARP